MPQLSHFCTRAARALLPPVTAAGIPPRDHTAIFIALPPHTEARGRGGVALGIGGWWGGGKEGGGGGGFEEAMKSRISVGAVVCVERQP